MYDDKLYDNMKALSLLILALSLVMISYGSYLVIRAQQSASWPTTAGKITQSEVVVSAEDKNSATFRIAYEFVVNQIGYTSNVYRFGAKGQYSSISNTKAKQAQYPKGGDVVVAYNPGNPADAVLEPGSASHGYLFLVLGIGIGILGPLFFRIKYWLLKKS